LPRSARRWIASTGLGTQLAGGNKLEPSKNGAQFHFSLPGSQQGFRPQEGPALSKLMRVGNAELGPSRALAVRYSALGPGQWAAVTTPTFSPPETLNMRTYDLMATPLVYPGQTVKARVMVPADNHGAIEVHLRVRVYYRHDRLRDVDSAATQLHPGDESIIEWQRPEFDGQPIAEIGLAFRATGKRADGTLLLDYLRWDGARSLTLHRPAGDGEFWRMAWVNGVDLFSKRHAPSFYISQNRGEGLVSHGTTQWTDYEVKADIAVHLGSYAGIAVRVQGLRRYYGARVTREGKLQIVRVRDDETKVLVETPFAWRCGDPLPFAVRVRQNTILASVGDATLSVEDFADTAFRNGGVGLFIHEGTLSTDVVTIVG
jgi:hypothetical protein